MAEEPSRTRRRIDFLRPGGRGAADAAPTADSFAETDPRFPDWKREGEFLYRRRQYFRGRAVEAWPARFSPEAADAGDLVFYDTETTGLSGGAGTTIFLFGAAWCEGPDLAVEQLFLSDFPGEPEFLLAVRDLFRPYKAFVSFNGKTFDSHLLASRFRMNRLEWEPGPQVDLVHHARRLWRSVLGDCSLRSMESNVLGFTRELDVAGADIPLVWLQFLRTGMPGILPVVFDHNIMDIVSLARLYGLIGALLEGEKPAAPFDGRTFGTWLIRSGETAGIAMLEETFRNGDAQAGIALALYHKRRREWERAAGIWEQILLSSRSLAAAVELAKYHEHRTRLYETALRLVETTISWNLPVDMRWRREIRKRRERLQRKLASRSDPPSPLENGN
jgi:uncharacterized protein YprB with RNaseH-like and TPR domain